MATLSLRLTTKGANLKGQLAVECSTKSEGAPVKRHYKVVKNLKAPVFTPECWNAKQGLFIAGPNAAHNNQVITTLLNELQEMIDTGVFTDGKQLFEAFEFKQGKKELVQVLTFGKFVEKILNDLKTEGRTSNYEQYNTLLNSLAGINKKQSKHHKRFAQPMFGGIKLIDTPLSAISNKHFIAFGDWIMKVKGGCGYRNLMTTFKAVISKAHQQELTTAILTFKFKDHIPVKAQAEMSAKQRIRVNGQSITILTQEEFQAFLDFDMMTIAPPQKRFQELCQLYKDVVLLMYYTKSRPADVLSFRFGKEYDEESHTIVYTPRKLVGRRTCFGHQICVTLQLPKEAVEIINRYKDQSKGGYLLPLPMNERAWDLTTEFPTWYIRVKNVEQRINQYLKKVAVALSLDVKDLSMYDFRHSAITHAIRAGENVFLVAQQAGTSVVNIEKHYFNAVRR